MMLLFSMILPVNASPIVEEKKDIDESPIKIVRNGYIETTIPGDYQPEEPHTVYGFGLFCHYGKTCKTTVYSEEGGDILWSTEGRHSMFYIFFNGFSQKTEDEYIMYGTAFLIVGISL